MGEWIGWAGDWVRVLSHTHIYIFTHTHTHIYIFTHTHTHIYIYILSLFLYFHKSYPILSTESARERMCESGVCMSVSE